MKRWKALAAGKIQPNSVTEIIYSMPSEAEQVELDEYRKRWEAREGRCVDLTRRYTCQLPEAQQDWLFSYEPRRFFDGLPEFMQEYYRDKQRQYEKTGVLAGAPPGLSRMFRPHTSHDKSR